MGLNLFLLLYVAFAMASCAAWYASQSSGISPNRPSISSTNACNASNKSGAAAISFAFATVSDSPLAQTGSDMPAILIWVTRYDPGVGGVMPRALSVFLWIPTFGE